MVNGHDKSVFKVYLYFLFLLFLVGYRPETAFSSVTDNKLDDYLSDREEEIAGLTVVIVDGDEIMTEMRGYSNIEGQTPVDEQTVFEWGSVSKILVWISVLQLAEAGELDLDTNINTYLPNDFHSKSTHKEPITMRHVMHHSAGFDDSYTDLMLLPPTPNAALREVLENADIKQVFAPGDVVAYSNYGAGLAAYIVEKVSGVDYREYVRKNILEPLQMAETALDAEQEDNKWVKEQRKKVQGYSDALRLIVPNYYVIPMYPAGSAVGTAADLQKLLQALLSEDGAPLFSDETTLDRMFEPTLYYPGTDIPRIANGLFYLPSESRYVFGHRGNTFAFSSSFYLDRKRHQGVIVLTNVQNETVFTGGIPEMIFGEYIHGGYEGDFEKPARWKGIYEPARLPHHGFSKVYGLFLRSSTKQSGPHGLAIDDLHYEQLEPGVYKTEDDVSMYGLDVYSERPQTGKMLSNTYSDLLYVPYHKHLMEWAGIILGLLSAMFSLFFTAAAIVRRRRHKKSLPILLSVQHFLQLLLSINVIWIIFKAGTMVSYSTLKPFLAFNLFYVVIAIIMIVCIILEMKSKSFGRREKMIWIVSIASVCIVCVNILYWEFY